MLWLTLFGRFSAAGPDGAEILLKSQKAQALLAYLALPLGKPRSREEIMALLWSPLDHRVHWPQLSHRVSH